MFSSQGSQNPKVPRPGSNSATAKIRTQAPVGMRRNLSAKLMMRDARGASVRALYPTAGGSSTGEAAGSRALLGPRTRQLSPGASATSLPGAPPLPRSAHSSSSQRSGSSIGSDPGGEGPWATGGRDSGGGTPEAGKAA